MLRFLRNFLFPVISQDERTRVQRSLNLLLPLTALATLFYGILYSWQYPQDPRNWIIFVLPPFCLACWWLAQRSFLRLATLLFISGFWVSIAVYSRSAIEMQLNGQTGFILVIFMAGLLLGGRYALFFLVLSAALSGWMILNDPQKPGEVITIAQGNWWILFVLYLLGGWILLSINMKNLRSALEKASQELEERRRAEAALGEQTEYLAALHETTLAIINRLDLDSLLGSILLRAESLADTPHGYIDLALPGGNLTRKHLGHGIFQRFVGIVLPIGSGVTSEVLRKGDTVSVEDYNTWENRRDTYANQGFYAVLGIPLKTQDRVIGVLGLAYDDPQRRFTTKRIEQLTQLANLTTLVLDNASLYQAAQDELAERTRTEKALRESQERLDLALSAAHMGIWDWEIENDHINWSDRVYEIWGIEKSEFKQNFEALLKLVHPDDRGRVNNEVNACLSGERQGYYIEHRILYKSGEVRWVESQGQTYRDATGKAVRMAGTTTDITERKRSEQVIQEANASLKQYTETLERRSGLLQLGAEVARAATAILNPHELSQQVVEMVQKQFGLYYAGLFLVEDDPHWAVLRAATGQAGIEMLRSGHRLEVGGASMIGWCIAHCQARIALDVGEDTVRFNNPLLPETRSELALPLVSRGEVLGGLTIQSDKPAAFSQEDIATFETMADLLANAILNARLYDQVQRELEERKRAEDKVRQLNVELEERVRRRTAALQASEEKFRALSENNPLQIARYDRDGRYLYVNHIGETERLQPENVLGKTLREVFGDHPSIEFAEQKIREVFDSGQPLKTEYELRGFVGLWSLAPEFDPEGRVVSVISSTLDITERKRTEEALEQRSAELQAANQELEAFSYSVSHDLRAPLRAIDGFTRILMDDFADQISPDGLVFLQRTRQAAQNMSQLIDDLLRLSRITRAELRLQPIQLNELAEEICARLEESDPERKMEFRIGRNLKASGDERLVQVALENLLNNAWKFTARTPNPMIEVNKTTLNGRKVFYVRDNGVGFDMKYADKLFGAFQRLHSPDDFPGTGIGLAIVQRIVRKHGGQVWAESEPGQGATFYFTLEEKADEE
jgi:PAS domain S-box-containing protein